MPIAYFAETSTPTRQFMDCIAIAIGVVAVLFAVTSDWLIERLDDTWTFPGFRGLGLKD